MQTASHAKSKSRRRVVVTGLGCVTPLGGDAASLWQGLLRGRSGVGPISLFDASGFPVRIAAEVPGDLAAQLQRRWPEADRQRRFCLAAATESVQHAGLDCAKIAPRRFGIYLGCGETYLDFLQLARLIGGSLRGQQLDTGAFIRAAMQAWSDDAYCPLDLNLPAMQLAGLLGANGPCLNLIAACATGTQVIGEATEVIRRGEADVMLAGAAHSMIHPLGLTGFVRLSALSRRNECPAEASRPFDRDRDGFVLGEGAAVLVLESLQHARRRGARILCEVAGYGSSHDATSLTDPHPQGRGAASAMRRALADAQLAAEQIDYINAHGTGTRANDCIETAAIKEVFGAHARQLCISSTKSMIGHCTTAAGAVEAVVCVLTLRDQMVHPTANLQRPDPQCDLDYVPLEARAVRCRHVLSTSYGFGGQNAALIFSTCQ